MCGHVSSYAALSTSSCSELRHSAHRLLTIKRFIAINAQRVSIQIFPSTAASTPRACYHSPQCEPRSLLSLVACSSLIGLALLVLTRLFLLRSPAAASSWPEQRPLAGAENYSHRSSLQAVAPAVTPMLLAFCAWKCFFSSSETP